MLPLLFLPGTPVLLVGRGTAFQKRLALLQAAGVTDLVLFGEAPQAIEGLPAESDIAKARLVFAAGLTDAESEAIAAQARALRIPVNVEDVPHLCDVHVPAIVRRGGLTLTVSTAGAAPALSAAIRGWLEEAFGPEWAEHLEEVAALRAQLRAAGATPREVIGAVRAHLASADWTPVGVGTRCRPTAPPAQA
jgi:precorrin-2 dehydrogenase/sirohydrochlorin ferrochelatase